ncbi:MAG: DUF2474 domain-containing protein [Novosphingobium sp.]|nr:DUF2474 domain-containing protein [Novosphingobium sp.]
MIGKSGDRKGRGFVSLPDGQEGPLWQRLGWMVAYWAGSVLVLGLVASAIRLMLKA